MNYIASTMPIFRNTSQVSGYQRPEPPKPHATTSSVAVVRSATVAFGHAEDTGHRHANVTTSASSTQPSNSNSSCNLNAFKAGLATAKPKVAEAAAQVLNTPCESKSTAPDHPCDGMVFSRRDDQHCGASPCDRMQWSPQAEIAMMCGNIMQSMMGGFGGGDMMSSLLMMNLMNQVKQRKAMAMAQMQQAMAMQQFQAFQMMSQAQQAYPMPLDNPGFGGPRPEVLNNSSRQLSDIVQILLGKSTPSMG